MAFSLKSSSARGFVPPVLIPVFLELVVASACIALAVWGKQFCRGFVDSVAASDAYAGLNHLAAGLNWALFFGPFVLLGAYALVRAGIRIFRVLKAFVTRHTEVVQILPPLPDAAMQAGRFHPYSPANAPLDDSTRRRLDLLAARAVKVIGIAAGLIFVGLGMAGFLAAWLQGRRPAANGEVIGFAFVLRFLVACGISVLAGSFILRETFARPKEGWLAPLRVFTAIAGRKLAEEEHARRNGLMR